jgi:Sec7-like guanine-nucleotide exchange factor
MVCDCGKRSPHPCSHLSLGALDNPVTPFSAAKFLRICPGLPKEAVGSFLGEAGRDNSDYEWNSPLFHKEVLHHYVRSFELSNQGILNCLRIFLSAFRLPGEAQQIDRILVPPRLRSTSLKRPPLLRLPSRNIAILTA